MRARFQESRTRGDAREKAGAEAEVRVGDARIVGGGEGDVIERQRNAREKVDGTGLDGEFRVRVRLQPQPAAAEYRKVNVSNKPTRDATPRGRR